MPVAVVASMPMVRRWRAVVWRAARWAAWAALRWATRALRRAWRARRLALAWVLVVRAIFASVVVFRCGVTPPYANSRWHVNSCWHVDVGQPVRHHVGMN